MNIKVTKSEVIEEAAQGEGCLGKAASDEPVFVLRAKDKLAPTLVRLWASFANLNGCPPEKFEKAMAVALRMEMWQENNSSKFPD